MGIVRQIVFHAYPLELIVEAVGIVDDFADVVEPLEFRLAKGIAACAQCRLGGSGQDQGDSKMLRPARVMPRGAA